MALTHKLTVITMKESQQEPDPSRDLVSAFLRQRDESSFRALYSQHTPMLFGLAMRLSSSPATAEEITQETWVRAVERISDFDGRSRFSTWLGGILVNCYRETRRQQARTPLSDQEQEQSAEIIQVFQGDSEKRLETRDIEAGLGQLAEGYREVVILHDLYGYTNKEIAGQLGIEEGTSKSQLARGRTLLQAILNPESAGQSHKDERGAK